MLLTPAMHNAIYPSYKKNVVRTNPRDNYQSTADTIGQMKKLVYESLQCKVVHDTAVKILLNLGANESYRPNELDIIRGCFWWVKHHLRFKVDEEVYTDIGLGPVDSIPGYGIDLLLSPAYVLSLEPGVAEGDCDDYSMLNAALLKAMGIQDVMFCTIAADNTAPENFTHVYTKVKLGNGEVISLDCSHGPYPGWQTDEIYRSIDWAI